MLLVNVNRWRTKAQQYTQSPSQTSKGQNFKHSPFPLTLPIACSHQCSKKKENITHKTMNRRQQMMPYRLCKLISLRLTVLFKDWTNPSSFLHQFGCSYAQNPRNSSPYIFKYFKKLFLRVLYAVCHVWQITDTVTTLMYKPLLYQSSISP